MLHNVHVLKDKLADVSSVLHQLQSDVWSLFFWRDILTSLTVSVGTVSILLNTKQFVTVLLRYSSSSGTRYDVNRCPLFSP